MSVLVKETKISSGIAAEISDAESYYRMTQIENNSSAALTISGLSS